MSSVNLAAGLQKKKEEEEEEPAAHIIQGSMEVSCSIHINRINKVGFNSFLLSNNLPSSIGFVFGLFQLKIKAIYNFFSN